MGMLGLLHRRPAFYAGERREWQRASVVHAPGVFLFIGDGEQASGKHFEGALRLFDKLIW